MKIIQQSQYEKIKNTKIMISKYFNKTFKKIKKN